MKTSPRENVEQNKLFSAHRQISGNCENQNPPFVYCERKPGFVVKSFHLPLYEITLSHQSFIVIAL